MNSRNEIQTAQAPAQTATAPWFDYLIFTLCLLCFLFPFLRALYIGSDEGLFLTEATEVLHGAVFSRDFYELVGPGSVYWIAAFFRLFGVSFLAARLSLLLPLAGTGLLLYFLSRRVCNRYCTLPCLLLAGPYFEMYGQVESHHIDSNFFALLAVVCLVVWLDSRKAALLAAAGALAGVSAWFLLPKGVLLLGAILVWLWFQRKGRGSQVLLAGLPIAGFAGVAGLGLSYFSAQGALQSLFYWNYTFVRQHYSTSNAVPYGQGIHGAWSFLATEPDGLHFPAIVAVILVLPLVWVAALPALAPAMGISYRWKTVTPEITLLWLSGWAIWASEVHRMDIHHLAYGAPLLTVLFVHMLAEYRAKIFRPAAIALTISAASLAGFSWLGVAAKPAIPTRVGSAAIFGPGVGRTVAFLDAHTNADDEIFVYPYAPLYYFLSGTRNPTAYNAMLYNFNLRAHFLEVQTILEQRKVKYVIWDTLTLPRFAKFGLMPGAMPSSTDQLILEPYLESHYMTVQDADGILVLERKLK